MKEVRPTTTLLRRAVGFENGRSLFFRIKVFDGTGVHAEWCCELTNVEDADWVGEGIDIERPLAHM